MMFWKKKPETETEPRIKRGDFILYRESGAQLTPARMQSGLAPVFAICDVTGIERGAKPRIVCGPVKWLERNMVAIHRVSEEALLTAPTMEGVKE
jgi:hypothetical protein